jgi:hypothetical protein
MVALDITASANWSLLLETTTTPNISIFLTGFLLQSVENIFSDEEQPVVFQDDIAPPHRSRAAEDWMFEHDIPAGLAALCQQGGLFGQSHDANPIENRWDDFERAIVKERYLTRRPNPMYVSH